MEAVGRFCLPMADGRHYDALRHEAFDGSDFAARQMLAGQELDAIHDVLFGGSFAGVIVVPSWECNLRCPHCYVLNRLRRPTGNPDGVVDFGRLTAFVDALAERRKPRLYVVGGEPFLHPRLAARLGEYCTARGFAYGCTTNGVWEWADAAPAIAHMDLVTFSLDGPPDEHNRVRRALNYEPDTFSVAYRNMRRVVREFPGVKVIAQGSVCRDGVGLDTYQEFRLLMLYAGVKSENITYGTAMATERKAGPDIYAGYLARQTRGRPCCDFSLGKNLIVYGDEIYQSYYRMDRQEPIGRLGDSVDSVLDRYKAGILAEMPMLRDPTCVSECRAVGLCWGLCSNAAPSFKDGRPSSVCDRGFKESKLADIVGRLGGADAAGDAGGECEGGVPGHAVGPG